MSNVRLLMAHLSHVTVAFTLAMGVSAAHAIDPAFAGTWYIDLRTTQQRQDKIECGGAYFKLSQAGDRITGDHRFATVGCARLNEGGEGTVKGVVVGATAVLVVTSGRNGAVVLGRATRRGGKLHWIALEEIRSGEPQGDSPLILGEGLLSKQE